MPEAPALKTKTEYLVLLRTRAVHKGAENTATAGTTYEQWELVDTVEAASAEAAIRKAKTDASASGKVLVAVPSRSWKPVKVSVETVSRVRLEDA